MRQFGMVMLLVGVVGFLYCSSELDKYPPVPPGLSIGASLEYTSGKLQVAQYGSAAVAAFGLLMTMFPKGR